METVIQLNSNAKLSEHFTLGEFTKSGSHPEVYNIPSHEAIANLKRLCGWLEVLRKRYNEFYHTTPQFCRIYNSAEHNMGIYNPHSILGQAKRQSRAKNADITSSRISNSTEQRSLPIIINSGYRSPQLNKEFDELLIERNRYGAMWLHFAVRPKDNRRKILFINA